MDPEPAQGTQRGLHCMCFLLPTGDQMQRRRLCAARCGMWRPSAYLSSISRLQLHPPQQRPSGGLLTHWSSTGLFDYIEASAQGASLDLRSRSWLLITKELFMSVFQNTPGNNQQQGNKPQPSQQEQGRPQKEGSHAPEEQKKRSEQEQAQQ